MRIWVLIVFIFSDFASGTPPDWKNVFADFPFALQIQVEVQGAIHAFPENAQQEYYEGLRRVLKEVQAYGETLPGSHVFRWTEPRTNLVTKELQFYFGDGGTVNLHFPNEASFQMPLLRALGIRGAVRQSNFHHCDYYLLQVPLDYHFYDRTTERPNDRRSIRVRLPQSSFIACWSSLC